MARWLPGALREARLVAPRQAALGLVAVALSSALVTAVLLWAARPRSAEVGAPPLSGAGTAPLAGSAPAVPSERAGSVPTARSVVLAVVGRVRHPGLVTVPAGSRVIDALRAAGGALAGVDLTSVNLARKVVDGEQIVVGGPAVAAPAGGAAAGSAPTPAGPVNLNAATLADLDALPGIGPVIAQRILDWRSAHGGFASVDQLGEVSGIGDRTLERLRGLVTV